MGASSPIRSVIPLNVNWLTIPLKVDNKLDKIANPNYNCLKEINLKYKDMLGLIKKWKN